MVEFPHDFYLVDEGLFSLFFTIGALLGEGFHCLLAAILMLNHKVNSSKVSLTDLLNWLEKLMEAALVQPCF